MGKVFKWFISVLVILLVVLVPLTILMVKFDYQSGMGTAVRNILIKYPKIVELINLNQPGDYRYYYKNLDNPIEIFVAHTDGNVVNDNLKNWLTSMVDATLKQPTMVTVDPNPLPFGKNSVSLTDLNTMRIEAISRSGKNTNLYIIYTSSYMPQPSIAGIVAHRDTIFIFKQNLESLVSQPQQLNDIEQSTIMHEWGHLLGLEHNDLPNCLMSATSDIEINRLNNRNFFPTTYCWDEVYELLR